MCCCYCCLSGFAARRYRDFCCFNALTARLTEVVSVLQITHHFAGVAVALADAAVAAAALAAAVAERDRPGVLVLLLPHGWCCWCQCPLQLKQEGPEALAGEETVSILTACAALQFRDEALLSLMLERLPVLVERLRPKDLANLSVLGCCCCCCWLLLRCRLRGLCYLTGHLCSCKPVLLRSLLLVRCCRHVRDAAVYDVLGEASAFVPSAVAAECPALAAGALLPVVSSLTPMGLAKAATAFAWSAFAAAAAALKGVAAAASGPCCCCGKDARISPADTGDRSSLVAALTAEAASRRDTFAVLEALNLVKALAKIARFVAGFAAAAAAAAAAGAA
ncbi:hypothetical protein Emed_004466 [Eimeria media]